MAHEWIKKKRGTFEERKQKAIERQKQIDINRIGNDTQKVLSEKSKKLLLLFSFFSGMNDSDLFKL